MSVEAAPESWCTKQLGPEHSQHMMKNFFGVWHGDYSLADKTFDPNVILASDRMPTGKGSEPLRIEGKDGMVAFVKQCREGWKEYTFDLLQSISEQNKISIQWKMNGVTGENMRIKTPLKPGSKVSFKGIDFIVLDESSGLIREINMAQDLITFFHELELGHVSV
ncbi:hypothetical protein CEP51_008996 [Fusarium floridanum]|uniref:SnoaL-like domain-containing protein n=1 Tax=Fusarium floridanum TaxID=1325733 RepID=A0A428RJ21_9HYPO|nr:hypothetical protein CEP51_008996 [Fusarium floridanum]